MSSNPASTSESLLDELQTTLTHGTVARRVETLRRVTDLFLNGAVDYSDEQIALFDDVFQCLMRHIEASAKALLARRLALIETARNKSQAHLMAISTRATLSGAVTDVLILRGNDEVVHSTVNNPGAE